MNPVAFKYNGNVWTAQAFGCWLYVQLGSRAWFMGAKMPVGLRFEWVPDRSWKPRIRFVRHSLPLTTTARS